MKSLLLIEDNPLLMELYKTAFEEQKINVLIAHEGKTGIALAKKNVPDLVVLDLLMVGLDGFEVLKQLKQSKTTKNIKAIILSLVSDQASKDRAKALGAADYLLKNELKTEEIVKIVMALLQKGGKNRPLSASTSPKVSAKAPHKTRPKAAKPKGKTKAASKKA